MGFKSAHTIMSDLRVRWAIARQAAYLMYRREESEYFTAKRKAARQMGGDHRFRPHDLPSNAEIREQIQVLADLYEGEERQQRLTAMRIEALRLMRPLRALRPRLIGSVLTAHIRQGSDIDIHVFSDSISAVTAILDEQDLRYSVERKRVLKNQEERVFTHVHVDPRKPSGGFPVELTVYAADKTNYPFKSSITGKTIERASIEELEALLRAEDPSLDLDAAVERVEDHADPLELFRLLLLPLEAVKQSNRYHPEGDALYHSLQVFELARAARPFDEEFLLAALLHDVGKAIDPTGHVAAALESLDGLVTERTLFLIEHHMDAHAARQGTLGARARRRLAESDDYDDLLLLSELDQAGRRRGAAVCTVDEALEYVRAIG